MKYIITALAGFLLSGVVGATNFVYGVDDDNGVPYMRAETEDGYIFMLTYTPRSSDCLDLRFLVIDIYRHGALRNTGLQHRQELSIGNVKLEVDGSVHEMINVPAQVVLLPNADTIVQEHEIGANFYSVFPEGERFTYTDSYFTEQEPQVIDLAGMGDGMEQMLETCTSKMRERDEPAQGEYSL